jgi:hypothetical protein
MSAVVAIPTHEAMINYLTFEQSIIANALTESRTAMDSSAASAGFRICAE